jgi:hypothetical protein
VSADFAELRLEGSYSAAEVVQRITQAIADCRARGVPKLLICTDQLIGLPSPSLSARHQMIREWAAASGGAVTIALVARPEYIDPERFGVVTAANFGMRGNVFDSEADAVAWLRS